MGRSIRFPGQYCDEEKGRHYNRFRYYDPSIGRYASADPIGQAGGTNVFLYAGGDPAGRVDPYGLTPIYPDGWNLPPGGFNNEEGSGAPDSADCGDGAPETVATSRPTSKNELQLEDALDTAGDIVAGSELLVVLKEAYDRTPDQISKLSQATAGAGMVVGGANAVYGAAHGNVGQTLVGTGEAAFGFRALRAARTASATTLPGFIGNLTIEIVLFAADDAIVDAINDNLGNGSPPSCMFGTCSDPPPP